MVTRLTTTSSRHQFGAGAAQMESAKMGLMAKGTERMTNRVHHVDPNHGFTQRADGRNLNVWPFALVLYKGDVLLIETIYKFLWILKLDVETSAERIRKGEATCLLVDGVPTDVWQGWINSDA